ncbi:uncharacterized protein [Nothobranchius furzeri]|uniref:uncharacterized protein n=1 Tax=Nothobranchius furzeri TaxID=105023 RepID=UPI003904C24E
MKLSCVFGGMKTGLWRGLWTFWIWSRWTHPCRLKIVNAAQEDNYEEVRPPACKLDLSCILKDSRCVAFSQSECCSSSQRASPDRTEERAELLLLQMCVGSSRAPAVGHKPKVGSSPGGWRLSDASML